MHLENAMRAIESRNRPAHISLSMMRLSIQRPTRHIPQYEIRLSDDKIPLTLSPLIITLTMVRLSAGRAGITSIHETSPQTGRRTSHDEARHNFEAAFTYWRFDSLRDASGGHRLRRNFRSNDRLQKPAQGRPEPGRHHAQARRRRCDAWLPALRQIHRHARPALCPLPGARIARRHQGHHAGGLGRRLQSRYDA